MLKYTAALIAAAVLTASAAAQEKDDRVSLGVVYFTHHECPDSDSPEAGSSPDNPIDIAFDELWYAVSSDAYDEAARDAYDCRWIRTSGFMTWKDYYHYRGDLHFSAADSVFGAGTTFTVENFAPGSPVRGDLVRRQMTLVARYYSLCGAANRAQAQAGQTWWLFGPCHYSYNHGLMLSDVRVEAVYDDAPQYLTGEANRKIIGSLRLATPAERSSVEPAVRAWAASLQKGLRPFVEDTVGQYPSRDANDRQRTFDYIENADSYESYLLNKRSFRTLNLATAQVEVYRYADDADSMDEFDNAIGCICLEASCADRWPLAEFDAENFLGPAACVTLNRRRGETWRW